MSTVLVTAVRPFLNAGTLVAASGTATIDLGLARILRNYSIVTFTDTSDTGAAPGNTYIALAGNYTTAGGSATEVAAITGVLATDEVIATVSNLNSTTVEVRQAAPGSNTVTLIFTADPGAGVVVSYVVLRRL